MLSEIPQDESWGEKKWRPYHIRTWLNPDQFGALVETAQSSVIVDLEDHHANSGCPAIVLKRALRLAGTWVMWQDGHLGCVRSRYENSRVRKLKPIQERSRGRGIAFVYLQLDHKYGQH